MSVIVLLGPPGSGRSKLTHLLAARLGLVWVPARDLLHTAALEPSADGLKLRLYLAAGAPAPARSALDVLSRHLDRMDWRGGAVMDGYPLSLAQAQGLDHWLAQQSRGPSRAIRLELPREEVYRRLSGRRYCRRCPQARYNIFSAAPLQGEACDHCHMALHQRMRDREDVVSLRVRRRHAEEMPLERYYRQSGLLDSVDAQGDAEAVVTRIQVALRLQALERHRVA